MSLLNNNMNNILLILIELFFIEVLALALLGVVFWKRGAVGGDNKVSDVKVKKRVERSFFRMGGGSFGVSKGKNVKVTEKISLFSRIKGFRLDQWIIIVLYFIVFTFIAYSLLSIYLPDFMVGINSGEYSVSLDNPTNKLSSLYFSKNIFSKVVEIDGEEFLPISSANIVNLMFKPKKIIEGERNATIEISGINRGTDVYIDDKLVIPDLSDYTMVREFSDGKQVWVRGDYRNAVFSEEGVNTQDFIYKNFPGEAVYSFTELSDYMPELTDYRQEDTLIGTTFRGSLKLAVYHGGGFLSVDFVKQDLNSYLGKDEYNVSVTNLDGDVLGSWFFEDDGVKKASKKKGEEQDCNFDINLAKGIYYVEIKADRNNPSFDVSLKDVKVNSNKILFVNRFLVWEENFEFYVKGEEGESVKFNYWWGNKQQNVKQSGDETKNHYLGEEWSGKKYEVILENKDYYFEPEKGYMYIYVKFASVDKDSYFDLPSETKSKLDKTKIIVIDKNWLDVDLDSRGTKAKVNVVLDENKKFKFQILDSYNFYINELRLVL